MKQGLKCAGCHETLVVEGEDFYLGNAIVVCPSCCRRIAVPALPRESAITLDDVRAVIREELANSRIVPKN